MMLQPTALSRGSSSGCTAARVRRNGCGGAHSLQRGGGACLESQVRGSGLHEGPEGRPHVSRAGVRCVAAHAVLGHQHHGSAAHLCASEGGGGEESDQLAHHGQPAAWHHRLHVLELRSVRAARGEAHARRQINAG